MRVAGFGASVSEGRKEMDAVDVLDSGFRVSQFRAAAFGAPVSGVRKGGRVVLLRGGGQAGPGEPSDWSARRAMRTEP